MREEGGGGEGRGGRRGAEEGGRGRGRGRREGEGEMTNESMLS